MYMYFIPFYAFTKNIGKDLLSPYLYSILNLSNPVELVCRILGIVFHCNSPSYYDFDSDILERITKAFPYLIWTKCLNGSHYAFTPYFQIYLSTL